MVRNFDSRAFLILGIIILSQTVLAEPTLDGGPSPEAEFRAFREKRLERLKSEDGWLTLVGLWWLHAGENSVGSADGSAVHLPASVPGRVGTIALYAGAVRFQPA